MRCWRCGIDFDGSEYLPESPCEDCQLDVPGNYLRVDVAATRERKRIETLIRDYYGRHYSDGEIGNAIGMARDRVRYWRNKYELPAWQDLDGSVNWDDSDRIIERARETIVIARAAKAGRPRKEPKNAWNRF